MSILQPTPTDPAELPPLRIRSTDFALLLLRICFALAMYYYQVRLHLEPAWRLLWEQKDWPLVDTFVAAGLPQPSVTALTLIFTLLVCSFAILIGFLTRINALLSLAAILFFFLSAIPLSDWLTGQTFVLFLGITATLALGGAGQFSCDAVFAAFRRRRKLRKAEARTRAHAKAKSQAE